MGSTLEAPRGSDGAKLDGAFGVTPVAGGCWPPGNPRFKRGAVSQSKGGGAVTRKEEERLVKQKL